MLVGFGPILFVALIAFVYLWFSAPKRSPKDSGAHKTAQPSSRR